jgi:hypothetical protein
MKTVMPLFNLMLSLLESAAWLLLVPVTLVAVAGLMGATALVGRQLRRRDQGHGNAQLWTRGFQRGA